MRLIIYKGVPSSQRAPGGVAKWNKKEGDALKPGDALALIETDKATVDFEVQEDGFLAKILVPAGTSGVPVNALIGIMVDDQANVAAFAKASASDFGGVPAKAPPAQSTASKEPAAAATAASKEPAAAAPKAVPKASQGAAAAPKSAPKERTSGGERVFASPYARKLARDKGYEVADISGSGPNGRVLAADVEAYTPGAQATSRQPLDALGMNKFAAPHYYLNVDVNFSALLALRDSLNTGEVKVGVQDFVIKAASLAMRAVPAVNSAWGDAGSTRTYAFCDVNVSTLQAAHGVVAPVIRGVHAAGLAEIATRRAAILNLAHDNAFTEDDLAEGTFAVTDVGAFGLRSMVPIIRPGQAAALGVGTLRPLLVPAGEGKAKVETVATLTLSCDHRVVDGAVGAQYLHHLKALLERPTAMLL